jgi:peptidase E
VAREVTLSGTSAGAILPFELAQSNPAKKPAEEVWEYEFIRGLGIIPAAVAAHANQHDKTRDGLRPDSRFEHFHANFPESASIGFAIENGAALVIAGQEAHISRSDPDAQIHIVEHTMTQLAADDTQLTAAIQKIFAA